MLLTELEVGTCNCVLGCDTRRSCACHFKFIFIFIFIYLFIF